jgi:hypothetical protein
VGQSGPRVGGNGKTHRRGLRAAIEDTLEDAPRSGCPGKLCSSPIQTILNPIFLPTVGIGDPRLLTRASLG